jgi:hypothetical protein
MTQELNFNRVNHVPMNQDIKGTVETKAKGQVVKYYVWSLDVWGNEEDGFEVNDRSKAGSIELPEDGSDNAWMIALEDAGFLKDGSHKVGRIDGDDGFYHVEDKRNGRPWLQLESSLS